MKKKNILIIVSGFFFLSIILGIFIFQGYFYKLFNRVSIQKIEQIESTLDKCDELAFSALLCNEIRVPFDDVSNTFYVPLNMKDDCWEKIKFISGQPEYKILLTQDFTEKNKSDLIANGERIPILVYDDICWAEYNLVFTGMPIINLTTNEGFYCENGPAGMASFYDIDFSKNGIIESAYEGSIRDKVNEFFPKKSVGINLKKTNSNGIDESNEVSVFNLCDDEWILNALYRDDTKIRDRLSMQVWDSYAAGAVSPNGYYGTKVSYVELVVDNVYWGIYDFAESVDAKQLELTEEDYLYEGRNRGTLKWHYFDFYDETSPSAEVQGFRLIEGLTTEDADLWLPMANLSAVLALANEKFCELDSKIIDEYNATNMWLFLQIITGHNHTNQNMYYIARYNEEYQFKYRFYFVPFDMNLTWGNVLEEDETTNRAIYKLDTMDDRVYWEVGDRLIKMNYHDSREYMCTLYGILRSTVLSDEKIENMIFDLDCELRDSGAFERDKERWGEEFHAESCKELVEYAKGRLHYLDKALYDAEYYEY